MSFLDIWSVKQKNSSIFLVNAVQKGIPSKLSSPVFLKASWHFLAIYLSYFISLNSLYFYSRSRHLKKIRSVTGPQYSKRAIETWFAAEGTISSSWKMAGICLCILRRRSRVSKSLIPPSSLSPSESLSLNSLSISAVNLWTKLSYWFILLSGLKLCLAPLLAYVSPGLTSLFVKFLI